MNKQATPLETGAADGDRIHITLRKGLRCYFDVDDITISVWGSAWSGRETVWLDDRIVSDRRNYQFSNAHRFEHAGRHYEVVCSTQSETRGNYRVELYRDGALLDSDNAGYAALHDKSGPVVWGWVLLCFVAGSLVGGGLAVLALRAIGGA